MLRESLKAFALKHNKLLNLYRKTFGKIKTKYYFGAQKKALQKKGYNLIDRINDVLNKEGAKSFIDCGTLLGMIRDKKLLEHDRDMDFGIYFDDSFTIRSLDEAMKSIGMKKHREFVFRGDVKEASYTNGIINVDFFKHEESKEFSDIYVFYRKKGVKYPSNKHYTTLIMHRAHIPSIETIDVKGQVLNVPSNYEEYLETAYSKNWRIPDPEWRYLMEPGLEEIKGEYGICQ